jgi:DNA-binding NtrC family response regulator
MVVSPVRRPQSVSPAEWQEWSNHPWLADAAPGGEEFQLCLRLIDAAALEATPVAYLSHELPLIASELAAQYIAVVRRGADWETVADFGRRPVDKLPQQFFSEALDRDAAGWVQVAAPSGRGNWGFCATPLPSGNRSAELLVLYGRGLGQETLPGVLAAARGLACGLATTRDRERLVRRHQQLTAPLTEDVELVGESPAIAALRSTVEGLAGSDLPVLLQGERGTGKDVVARSLHYRGLRSDYPFVVFDCAARAEASSEVALFGIESRADANDARPGRINLADGGTLVLDRIGDLDAGGQARLLHLLEHKSVLCVGGSQPVRINVRVVAATDVSLVQAVREKKFRQDLYYRLSVVALDLPPLRDRPEDILPLADRFLKRFGGQARRKDLTLAPESRTRLAAYRWPGNVRELRNLMERIAFVSPADRVEPSYLEPFLGPDSTADGSSAADELTAATARFQQDHIRRLIRRAAGNMTAAAELLGLHRSNLYRKMRQLKMSEAREGEG